MTELNNVLSGKQIVLGVCGSIAAYKAADLCSKLVQSGVIVYPVLTLGALQFIAPSTFWGLSGQAVAVGGFDQPFGPHVMAHLHYAEIADAFLVAPASADFLARYAAGLCDDMLSTALLANRNKPVFLAPAMNTDMWLHPATQANRQTLEKRGVHFIEPGVGRLAEGIIGAGRLAEPTEIVTHLREFFRSAQTLTGVRVLVTAGPTREAIDPVRFLSNRSSGKMGYAIAEVAANRGADVVLVSGPTNLPVPPGVSRIAVTTAAEMATATFAEAETADVIIAAAAVADYTPETVAPEKIKKSSDVERSQSLNSSPSDGTLTLILRPTEDILQRLGTEKRDNQILVGFAAETQDVLANAQKKLFAKNLDLIVANDVTQEGAGFDTDTNIVTLLPRIGEPHALPKMSKHQVASILCDWLHERSSKSA